MKFAMPSPTGRNRNHLFLDTKHGFRVEPKAAYDSRRGLFGQDQVGLDLTDWDPVFNRKGDSKGDADVDAKSEIAKKLLRFLAPKLNDQEMQTFKRVFAALLPDLDLAIDEDQPPEFKGRPTRPDVQAMDSWVRGKERFEKRWPQAAKIAVS